MAFETKFRRVRFVGFGYTAEQMAGAASAVITRAIVPRIQSGLTVTDSAAPALKPNYAKVKARKHPPAVRNWTFTGRTLRSMKVLVGAPNKAIIGFIDPETNKRAAINNRRSRQFGISGTDGRIVGEEFGKLPPHTRAVEI